MNTTKIGLVISLLGALMASGCGGEPLDSGDTSVMDATTGACATLTFFEACAPSFHPLTGICLAGDNTSTDPAKSLPQWGCSTPLRDTQTGELYVGTCVASCP